MPLQQPQNSQDIESTLNCSEHNCILKNACIDHSAIKSRFVIRIIGNESHVQEIKTLAENAILKAYRESTTFLFEGLQKNVTFAIAMNSTAAVIKLDIEGSEYELFETEILSKNIPLPRQLLFELHTERADPRYVPPNTVRGKNRTEVNDLFLRLYDIGYRIVGMEINSGDGSCADIGMVLVDQ